MAAAKEGILLAVDGIDGAGKTTQVKLLADALRAAGENVLASKEPTDGQWGRRLRQSAQNGRLSLEDELHAFIEDRKEHVATTILPALAAGSVVLLDRYFYSTIAYQGARGADVATLVE
jgi:dTMP kinase